jgi:hypothetical protein
LTDNGFAPEEVLCRPVMAHLASGSPEGARESPLWFLWEDRAVWLIATSRDSFPKRLRSDPRCAIGVVDFDAARGILRHVGIRGSAQVGAMDRARRDRLLSKYLGDDRSRWNPWFVQRIVEPLDVMVGITPASIVARDMSYFRTGPELAR